MGREKAVKHGGPRQAPSDAQDHRNVCDGMHLLYGRGQAVSPGVAECRQPHSALQTHTLAGLSPE